MTQQLPIFEGFVMILCDQMLKSKVDQSFPKVAQNVATAVVTWKVMFSKSLTRNHIFGLILTETLTQIIFKNRPIGSHWLYPTFWMHNFGSFSHQIGRARCRSFSSKEIPFLPARSCPPSPYRRRMTSSWHVTTFH